MKNAKQTDREDKIKTANESGFNSGSKFTIL